jgi:hypothetical protein
LVKFDLTRKSIAAFPELARIHNEEGAVRSSVIAEPAAASDILKVRAASFVVVKAPTLEGTELWLVSLDRQEDFEKSMGFEKASVPLLSFQSERLEGLLVLRDPEGDESFPIRIEKGFQQS